MDWRRKCVSARIWTSRQIDVQKDGIVVRDTTTGMEVVVGMGWTWQMIRHALVRGMRSGGRVGSIQGGSMRVMTGSRLRSM